LPDSSCGSLYAQQALSQYGMQNLTNGDMAISRFQFYKEENHSECQKKMSLLY